MNDLMSSDLQPRRRLSSVLWRAVALHALALLVVFVLAYSAGARSGGLSILDFGALPSAAGLRLWAAALVTVLAGLSLVWITTRILHPLKQLTEFSEQLGSGTESPPPASDDDFGLIADRLGSAADRLAVAAADQSELASLRQRIGEFSGTAQQAAAGDLAARAQAGDDELGQALASLNTALEAVGRLLQGARKLAASAGETANDSLHVAQQAGKTLAQQEREIASASEAFAVIPPSVKQVSDNCQAVARASENAGNATEQARGAMSGTQAELQRLAGSLRSSGDTLSKLRQATEHVVALLRPLSEVTERANLLALNAALEAARSGQAGRTSTLFAEQFRDLAQESNKVSGEVAELVGSILADGAALLNAVGRDAHAAQAAEAVVLRATQALESAATATQEASARAEVASLASARQADAARNVTGALQAAMDLERLAAQQVRQNVTVAEQLQRSIEELKSALAAVRTSRAGMAAQARAAVGQG